MQQIAMAFEMLDALSDLFQLYIHHGARDVHIFLPRFPSPVFCNIQIHLDEHDNFIIN